MEQFKASEIVERINELIEKHGDVPVAVNTEDGTFAALGCYYDIFAESIIISEWPWYYKTTRLMESISASVRKNLKSGESIITMLQAKRAKARLVGFILANEKFLLIF